VVALEAREAEPAALCCAYVVSPARKLSPGALKQKLTSVLPAYMIPSHWSALDQMPHNANGKADRALIKERFRQLCAADVDAVPVVSPEPQPLKAFHAVHRVH
jgi:acyl-CoA synthetase (AMP-forming)/AMP-acid ligase II